MSAEDARWGEIDSSIGVLVPDATGDAVLAGLSGVVPIRYELGIDPTARQRTAAVIVLAHANVDEAVRFMNRLPALRLAQTLNAGYDQWQGRMPPTVALSNARGAHGRATAEWVAAVVLGWSRRLMHFADAQDRQVWEPRRASSLVGKRVAVLGAGDVGTWVRHVLAPFGCPITMVARTAREGVISLDEFIGVRGDFDVVIVVLPLTGDTRRLFDARFLAGLMDGALVVNAGRGALIDQKALVNATQRGRIHAILDVTDPEPLPSGDPLWMAQNVTITPHVGGSVEDVEQRAWAVAVEQIRIYARGEKPPNIVIGASPATPEAGG